MSKSTSIADQLSGQEYETAFSMTHPSSMTFGHSTPDMQDDMLEKWISSVADFPVSRSVSLATLKPTKTIEIYGLTLKSALSSYDLNMRYWKTSQGCLFTNTFAEFSETWLRSGMIVNGMLYQLVTLVPNIYEKESGFLPTPTVADQRGKRNQKSKMMDLREWWRKHIGGLINPCFVESIMGWPIGWTDLQRLEMDGFHRWLKQFCE